jgi:carbonic anhydrase
MYINYTDLINGLLGEGQVAYWTYSGSFTTPPCTEEVTFVILKKIAQMSGKFFVFFILTFVILKKIAQKSGNKVLYLI